MSLRAYGWTDRFESSFKELGREDLQPARVLTENREVYGLYTAQGVCDAVLSGRLRHAALGACDLPVVGDWVAVNHSEQGAATVRIQAVLPRRTQLSRKAAGTRTVEQPVAANLDCALLIMGLDGDFNPRRMERLVVAVRESGADPVVILNKEDLCPTADRKRRQVEAVAPGVPVHLASFVGESDLSAIRALIRPRETIVLMGSSGVGKTTLLNRLCGSEQFATKAVRADDQRGRHTTTQRQLVLLPGGGLLMDNPGIREVGLWTADQAIDDTFADIAGMADDCRFRDCGHAEEPGCAVLKAVEQGVLPAHRLESYRMLLKERQQLALRRDVAARRQANRGIAAIHRAVKKHKPRS